ncbi:MAG: hypothetical protein H0W86_13000 [Armatimonadetes bacterium]|nr:hypothetical protein [Armatimonadota bacterium]
MRAAVEEYAQAIEQRDIGAVRRVYPGLTPAQQSGLERFFQVARRINVTFRVSALEVTGATAEARVVGTYEYVNAEGQPKTEQVSLGASFRHDGSVWRLVSVR